jgi:hypothetical protein
VTCLGSHRYSRDAHRHAQRRTGAPGGRGRGQPQAHAQHHVSRRLDVHANVRGRDLGSVAQEVEKAVQKVAFPIGYHPHVLGEYRERRDAQRNMPGVTVFAVIGIFLLLQASFRNWRACRPWPSCSLPAALVGGTLAAYVGGGVIFLGSLVGFLTVLGISARNGILFIDHCRHLEREEGETFGPDLVLRGARERLSPILMTVALHGTGPRALVYWGNLPGHQIEYRWRSSFWEASSRRRCSACLSYRSYICGLGRHLTVRLRAHALRHHRPGYQAPLSGFRPTGPTPHGIRGELGRPASADTGGCSNRTTSFRSDRHVRSSRCWRGGGAGPIRSRRSRIGRRQVARAQSFARDRHPSVFEPLWKTVCQRLRPIPPRSRSASSDGCRSGPRCGRRDRSEASRGRRAPGRRS